MVWDVGGIPVVVVVVTVEVEVIVANCRDVDRGYECSPWGLFEL